MNTFTSPISFLGKDHSNTLELLESLKLETKFAEFIPKYGNGINQPDTSKYISYLDKIKLSVEQFDKEIPHIPAENLNQKKEELQLVIKNKMTDNQASLNGYLSRELTCYSEKGKIVSAFGENSVNKGKGAYIVLSYTKFKDIEEPISEEIIQGIVEASKVNHNLGNENSTYISSLITELRSSQKSFSEQSTKYSTDLTNLQKQVDSFIKNNDEEVKKKISEFVETTSKTIADNNKLIKEHEDQLISQKNLKSSAHYWIERKNAALLSIVIGVVSLILVPIIMTILSRIVFGTWLMTGLNSFLEKGNSTNPNLTYVSVFLVVSIIFFYIVSSLIKFIFNQVNIVNDCLENITKTQYYLALIKEKGIDDKHREIMLKAIFEQKNPHISIGNAIDHMPIKQVFNSKS